jgi:hypothetical protein
MGPEPRVHGIYAACWWVRHYREQRTVAMRLGRAQAIQRLGLAVRDAFNSSDDFEVLLTALVDGLTNTHKPPF